MASSSNRRGKAKTYEPWTTTEEIALCKAWCEAMKNYTTRDMRTGFWFKNALAEFQNGYGHPFAMEACWRILKNHATWTEVEMPTYQRPMDKKQTQSNPSTPEKPPMPPISSFLTIEESDHEREICHGYLTEKEHQQPLLDEEALRETLEEEAKAEKERAKAEKNGMNLLTKNKLMINVVKKLKNPRQAARDVQVGPKVGFRPVKQVYRHVYNRNNANTSAKKQAVISSKEVSNSDPFDVFNSVENDDDMGTNGRNSKSAGKGPNSDVSPSNHEFFNVASSSTSTTLIVDIIYKNIPEESYMTERPIK
ncbi:hypothetical protein Tco_1185142 [Tanacetum coccineum]